MPADRPQVSVVLPVRDERENLGPLLAELAAVMGERAYEVIAVDDGSTDGSLLELRRLREGQPRLRVLALHARTGQSAALAAGWAEARGDIVVTLDADGQNDPADIPALLAALNANLDVAAVVGVRAGRRDSRWKRVQSRIANGVRNWVTGHRVSDTGCGLKVARRSALADLPRFDGMHRFLPTLLVQAGGRVLEQPVAHRSRWHGRSKYGMWNRVFRGVQDCAGVRWLGRRRLRYQAHEVRD